MSKFINNFRNFFSKKKEQIHDEIDFDEIKNTIKDSLYGIKDFGFDIKMLNFSFEPVTINNLSIEIFIKPNDPRYNIDEVLLELDNAISHIEHSDMNVEMKFNINMDSFNRSELHIIHSYLVDIYPNIFNLPAKDTVGGYLSKVDNYQKFVNHTDIDQDTVNKLKLSIVIKLNITGKIEN